MGITDLQTERFPDRPPKVDNVCEPGDTHEAEAVAAQARKHQWPKYQARSVTELCAIFRYMLERAEYKADPEALSAVEEAAQRLWSGCE